MFTPSIPRRRRDELDFDDWIEQLCQQFTTKTGLKLTFHHQQSYNEKTAFAPPNALCWKHPVLHNGTTLGHLTLWSSRRYRPEFLQAVRQLEPLVKSIQQVGQLTEERKSLKQWLLADLDSNAHSIETILEQASLSSDFRGYALFQLNSNEQMLTLSHQLHKDDRIVPDPIRKCEALEADCFQQMMLTIRRGDAQDHLLPADVQTAVVLRLGTATQPLGTIWVFDRRVRTLSPLDEQFLLVLSQRVTRSLLTESMEKVQTEFDHVNAQLDVATSCTPATELYWERIDRQISLASQCHSVDAVGGDLCEFWTLEDGSVVFAIGDATGHHVPAAIVMSFVRGALYSLTHHQLELQDLMTQLNTTVYELTQGVRFMSLILGRIDLQENAISLVNAGHPLPILVNNQSSEEITTHGMLLGIIPESQYEVAKVDLKPGQSLLMTTDGILEMPTQEDSYHGITPFIEQMQQHPDVGSLKLVRLLWKQFCESIESHPRQDDCSLMVIRAH